MVSPTNRLIVNRAQAQQTTQNPSIRINLTSSQKIVVHKARRDQNSIKVKITHNNHIRNFIEFVKKTVEANPEIIENGSIDDLVKKVDFNDDNIDQMQYVCSKTKVRNTNEFRYNFRDETLVWNNISSELVYLYYSEDKYNCKMKKGEYETNEKGERKQKMFSARIKVLHALEYGRKIEDGKFNEAFVESKTGISRTLKVTSQEAKMFGLVDERAADAIPFPLYRNLCEWAIKTGNTFLWVMVLLQWNCIARCQNIDELTFKMFSMGTDSIRVQYFQTKKDQTGEKTTPKNCYCNPFDFTICLGTGLAVWFCHLNLKWTETSQFIFINEGSEKNSASSRYCDAVKKWAHECKEKILEFIRPNRVNPHGIRKGGATEVTANTAETSLPSVFHRGEWSLGIILDIYWKFAERGDQTIGRILAGLNPEEADFDTLPPHFVVGMENEHVKNAMYLMFGNIVRIETKRTENSFVLALLLRCLAAFVHHSDSILAVIDQIPGHRWRVSIPLYSDGALLDELKKLVTTEPTKGVMEKATGATRHTKIMKSLREIKHVLEQIGIEREDRVNRDEELKNIMKEAVKEAFEQKALELGHLTYENVNELMDRKLEVHREETGKELKHYFTDMKSTLEQWIGPTQHIHLSTRNVLPQNENGKYPEYRRGMYIPDGYKLPSQTDLLPACRLWINGDQYNGLQYTGPNGERLRKLQPVRPLYLWDVQHIPNDVWNVFKVGWRPILNKMMMEKDNKIFEQRIISEGGHISEADIEKFHERGRNYVLETHSYIDNVKSLNWKVTTWSSRTSRNVVEIRGTAEDKAKLGRLTRYNNKHTRKRRITKKTDQSAVAAKRLLSITEILGEKES
jgi:hypothetical protein